LAGEPGIGVDDVGATAGVGVAVAVDLGTRALVVAGVYILGGSGV
jgi:hypothetical protein